MKNAEFLLRCFLRVVGTSSLFALVAVVIPYSWMDWIHRVLGMGNLPAEPVVGYLARSASAFYAMFGGLLWCLSFDLRRNHPVLRYVGTAVVVFGVILFCVDWVEGMPLFWKLGEGPANIGLGVILLALLRRVRPESEWGATG